MKISKLFHWLYASVMFLPLLIIPIFAIYTINHEPTPLTIEVEDYQQVDFNQIVPLASNETFSVYDTGATATFNGSEFTLSNATGRNGMYLETAYRYPLYADHKYLIKFDYFTATNDNWQLLFSNYYQRIYYTLVYSNTFSSFEQIATITSDSLLILDFFPNQTGVVSSITVNNLNVFDLTQMFGSGYEPTINEFNNIFTASYYPQVMSEPIYIDTGVFEYNDTDIGSQYLYALYHTTDKYFNFDDVLNLGAISRWLDTYVFNGNTPLGFIIVWHYLDYWLLVSIFWLCFDVLIYVPQIAHRWLDKASLE